jgi:hypothetical protein
MGGLRKKKGRYDGNRYRVGASGDVGFFKIKRSASSGGEF